MDVEKVKCESWLHFGNRVVPRATHWHPVRAEWRCMQCVQEANRERIAFARKSGIEFISEYITAEERLMQILAGK